MRYKNLKYTYNITGLAIVIFLTLRESMSVVLLHTPLQKGTPLFLLLSIVVFALSCFVPVVVMENMLGLHPLLFKKVNAADAAATAAFGYLILLAAGMVNTVLLRLLEVTGLKFAPQEVNIPQSFLAALLYFVYICVMPPLLEEIFVRGLILNALKGWGTPFAVIVSSVVFSLMHSSLHNFVLYFICGVVLAKIYLAFDSLLPCMLLHFVNNSVAFLMSSFAGSENPQSALFLMLFIYFAAVTAGVAGFKYLQKRNINLAFSFTRIKDLKLKFTSLFKSYAGLLAVSLLLFMAAYKSYLALIK